MDTHFKIGWRLYVTVLNIDLLVLSYLNVKI